MQATTTELAVCYGCKSIFDKEEMIQCSECDQTNCMNCDCACSVDEVGPSAFRLRAQIIYQDSRRWLLSKLDAPLAALLGVVVLAVKLRR
jgi:hypothetical protein